MYKVLVIIAGILLISGCDKARVTELEQENNALKGQVESLNTQVENLNRQNQESQESVSALKAASERLDFLSKNLKGVTARIVTNQGNIDLEFFPDKAPLHSFAFITRAESGYYDGATFHRIIKNFMIQGGDPNSKDDNPANDGQGGPIVNIPHEFNDTKHEPGILSMARVSDVNAGAGSQFFIMHGTSPNLDNQYTAFGKVVNGTDIVDKIANVKTGPNDRPEKPVVITRIEVSRG